VEVTKTTKDYYAKENELADYKSDVRTQLQQRDYISAKASARKALDLSLSHFTKNHPVTASCYSDLGLLNKELGDYDEAKDNYLRASAIYEETVGKEHPSYATMINNLGWVFRRQSESSDTRALDRIMLLEKALECFEECYKIRSENLGEGHADTLQVLGARGGVKLARGEGREGEVDLRKAHELARRVGDSCEASAAHNLAVLLKTRAVKEKKNKNIDVEAYFADAKRLYESALAWRIENLGEGATPTIMTMSSLAELKQTIEGEDGGRDLWERIKKVL